MIWFLLVPLLPLATTLLIALGDREQQEQNMRLGAIPILLAFLGAATTLLAVSWEGPIVARLYNPDALAGFALPLGFYIDRLGAVMMTLITLVATVIYVYSQRYMYQDPHYRRYMGLIAFTTFVLLCMVTSANLIMLFVFWQILSWLLFLLAHNHEHDGTLDGAMRTFTILRVGDVAFLAGIVVAYTLYGTVEFDALFARVAVEPATLAFGGFEVDGATAVALLLLIGGMSKSAQFPLHIWLAHSLYAPTPVHALLHAGIINAGGFLMNRLAPLFGQSPTSLHVAFVVGTLTAVLGATMMLTQNDIKKTLGHSTIGQMGYMIMECGLGAFSLAVFHLIAHGLFKGTVFLNCGNVIHKARQEPALPHVEHDTEDRDFSTLTWSTGFFTTLIVPLVILLGTHGILRIPLLDSHGTVIFLFFIWVTSSQAILSLTRIREVASWKVSLAMLVTLVLVIFTYLFAAETFTHFLYPNPDEVAGYFKAAALPGRMFDVVVVGMSLFTVFGWIYLYARAHGRSMPMPRQVHRVMQWGYVLFMNRLYMDVVYARMGRALLQIIGRLERVAAGWRT